MALAPGGTRLAVRRILVGLILVLAALLPRLRHVFGLPERFFLGVTYIWLVVVAWLLAVKAH